MKRIIINADDFGYSAHTVAETIRSFEAGWLTSATMMVGAEAIDVAAAYARRHPQWSYGIHLCLTDEKPMSRPENIPTLIGPDGLLWPTRTFILRSVVGLIRQRDVEREIRAQVDRFRQLGLQLSHVDGHGHVHRLPVVLRALVCLSKELDISRIRPAQNLFFARLPPVIIRRFNQFMNCSLRRHFRAPEHFIMITSRDILRGQAGWLRALQPRLPDGCTELGVHPGTDNPARRLDLELLGSRVWRDTLRDVALVSYYSI
jgi:predicted glycoside hydrolase/deacetylase ChbG (UPF0249 family)